MDIPETLKDVLHLNGEYLGIEVGSSVNPQRDIKTLCKMMLQMHSEMQNVAFKKEMLGMSKRMTMMTQMIASLKNEVKELKICYTSTSAPDAGKKKNGSSK